jgi:hypothetical protein
VGDGISEPTGGFILHSSSYHEGLTMKRRAISAAVLTTILLLACGVGAEATEEKADPASVEEAF